MYSKQCSHQENSNHVRPKDDVLGNTYYFVYFAIVKYVNPITGVAFIACGRDYYRMVWSALTFIRTITIEDSARPCMFRVLHVGGKKILFFTSVGNNNSCLCNC